MKIVVVCTGNICRSPAMELLLADALDDSVEVTSAGTQGMPRWEVSPPMADLLVANKADSPSFSNNVSNFRSKPLTEQMVRDADLILTATSAHRADVLNLSPLALRRTMSLGELARLSQTVDPAIWQGKVTDAERLKALVPAALAARHPNPNGPEADDIVDPYKRSNETYQRSFSQITGHIDTLVNSLHR